MKPLKLVVEGFMPFKARTEIDFTGLQLFAIQGATGSGKSSLLDAITYALYGKTDRLGATGAEALISSGEQGFSIELTFAQGADIYRATRTRGRKASQNNVRLDKETEPGRWQNLASSSKAAEGLLTKLLGLDFQSFTRAIMLPQGKFNALLHGKKSERQALLGELTDLGHVAEMYSYAAKHAGSLQAELKTKQAVLEQEYSDVSAEALSEVQAESQALDTKLQQLTDDRDSLQQRLTRLRAQEGLYREQQELVRQQSTLLAQAAQVEAGAARAQQARSVAHILPLLEAARLSEQQHQRSLTEASAAQTQMAQTEQAQAQASAALETLRVQQRQQQVAHAAELEHLEQLGQVLPLLRAQQAQAQAQARVQATVSKQQQAVTTAQQQLRSAQQAEISATEQAAHIPGLEQRGQELQQAQALFAKLKQFGATPQTTHTSVLEWDEQQYFAAREAGRKLDEARRHLSMIETAKASLERQQQEYQVAFRVFEADQKRLQDILQQGLNLKAQQEEAKRELHATGLAQYHQDLQLGQPCPLCGQTVHDIVPLQAVSAEEISHKVALLEEKRVAKLSEYHELKGKLSGAEKQLEKDRLSIEQGLKDNAVDAETLRAELSRFEGTENDTAQAYLAGLAQKVSQFGPDPATQHQKLLAEIAHLRAEQTRSQQALSAAQSALAAAQASLSTTQEQLTERQAEAQQAQAQLTERLSALNLSAQQLEAAPDPAQERRKLQAQAETLQRQLDQAQQAQAQAASAQAAAAATYQAAQTTLQQRQAEAQQAQATLETALAKVQLSAQQVSAAALPDDQIAALETALRHHQAQAEQLKAALEALAQKLGAAPFDPAELTQVGREHYTAESALATAQQDSGKLKHRIEDLTKRLERKREQQAQSSTLARQADLWATLSSSLKTNEFQQFLLEDLESRLLEGAGALLSTISDGRYRLSTIDGEYMVQDLWNAGELRGVKTLSGGETFLASLALAITLSDYLAGSKVLGALFLDEGFGTLDPQALESVAEALENLRTQGRMVGVITHVESLSERMPSRLVVSKSVAGSSVTRIDE